MIKIEARHDTEDNMSIIIEANGPMFEIKQELRKSLYQTYKQFYETNGIKALHAVCEATKYAMSDIIQEVLC